MNPKVSICIPTYQQADKLLILFRSIEQQSFRDFEVIVTDDSHDNEVEDLCKSEFNFSIQYHRNNPSKGSPENWNSAISKAKGEWIKLIHHDDYFYNEESLAKFVDEAEKFPETDYFFCRTSILDTHSGDQYSYSVNTKLLNRISEFSAYLFHKNLIGAPSTGFFKNGLVETYDKLLIWLVDIEFYCRLLKSKRVRGIDAELITTTISEKQLTSNLKNNRNVELREFFYCYAKLIGNFDRINRKIMRHRMLDLFKEFNVSSIADLKSTGIKNLVPTYALLFFVLFRISPHFAFRLFYKLNHFSIP
jgi:glycosyltransferase involved in cell wall biosynthesis